MLVSVNVSVVLCVLSMTGLATLKHDHFFHLKICSKYKKTKKQKKSVRVQIPSHGIPEADLEGNKL